MEQNRPSTGFEPSISELYRWRRLEAPGNGLCPFHKCEVFLIQGKTVEPGPMLTGKPLKMLKSPLLLEDSGIAFKRMHRIEDAGTSAG